MIPPDFPWMPAALGSYEMARDPDRSIELRLLRLFVQAQDAAETITFVVGTGVPRRRVQFAFDRLRYLDLIEFKRDGWIASAAGKAALASQDAPPVANRPGPSMATKQLSLF